MIYRYGGPGSDLGLTPWFAITYNPQQSINQLPLLALAGVIYHGLIPGRGDDNLGCGCYYGQLSTALPGATGRKGSGVGLYLMGNALAGHNPRFSVCVQSERRQQ